MPILNKPSFITKLFSFRKTMTAASASPVPKLGKAAEVKQAPAPKRRKASSRTHEKHTSIFARIASSFKARKERNQSKAQIKTIRKQIKNEMPDLKANIPIQLQDLVKEMNEQEISRDYINNILVFSGTFTDQSGEMTSEKSILVSTAGKNQKKSAEVISDHLTNFCGGDKNQASTLSVLLTDDATLGIQQQLQANSSILDKNTHTSTRVVERDVLMMADNTARIVIKQDYRLLDASESHSIITVKTTLDVPRQDPSSITLNRVDITPRST